MLIPSFVNIVSYYYPIGNTPAVCLTQDLAPEQDARILLLGCGDVRNILFTTYSDSAFNPRMLDLTCCDIEKAVIARNALLFTLLADDVEGLNDSSIWNLYYHVFLDDQSLAVLQTQAEKLHALATTTESWHKSRYGKLLRFCDKESLRRVRDVWGSYLLSNLSNAERVAYDRRVKMATKKAIDHKKEYFGTGPVMTGLRSAAPISFKSVKDLPDLHQHYWDHGTTDKDPAMLSKVKHPNPTFAAQVTDTLTLHYGTDPLLGFHLATAYAPLSPESPLRVRNPISPNGHKVVDAARLQFQDWVLSFRRCISRDITIRFFIGDALGFAHALENKRTNRADVSTYGYRGPYQLDPIIIDGIDYETGKAPLSFNVIETSNLVDHVGALNLLVATSPLLEDSISATLYTESLVRRAEDRRAFIDTILCGHFPTISTLLGLFPVEYWTNASSISTVDEHIVDMAQTKMNGIGTKNGQMHVRLTWKTFASPGSSAEHRKSKISFKGDDLAKILHEVYRGMFQHENMSKLFAKIDLLTLQNNSIPHYHRGSFAKLLCFIKRRVEVDWQMMMEVLLRLIENDTTILMGRNYIQELYLQLHILGIHSMPTFTSPLDSSRTGLLLAGVNAWTDVPPVVFVTLKVPRAKLRVFTRLPATELGTPIVHCILQCSNPGKSSYGRWQNIFSIVQLTFGNITTSGSRNSNTFSVKVSEDLLGWSGTSSLIACFCVPAWVVLLEPDNTTIAFGVQSTPQSSRTFMKTLGLNLDVYSTKLEDKDNVFITKNPPNQMDTAVMGRQEKPNDQAIKPINNDIRTTITAVVDQDKAQVIALSGRIDVKSEVVKATLRDQAPVQVTQVSPRIIGVLIGKSGTPYLLHFPTPVLGLRTKTRVARKSSYVEVIVPIASPFGEGSFPHYMYPVYLSGHIPIIWNMPYLNLDCLPIFDAGKTKDLQWLIPHTSFQMSGRERALREDAMRPGAKPHNDLRVNFKDSLFSIFMHFTGLQGKKSRVFGISNPTGGGVHILLFVSCLRLDLGNHTAVLDVAVLPLYEQLMPRLEAFLGPLSTLGLCTIIVDDDELRLWKGIIPAMVERCRRWKHRSSCEYVTQGKIPLSVEGGKPTLCSCGNGTLPPRFITGIPAWDIAAKYAVRAAISPTFSVPYVEETVSESMLKSRENELPSCWNCGKLEDGGVAALLNCSRCRIAKYCSSDCQRKDWKEHKKVCKK